MTGPFVVALLGAALLSGLTLAWVPLVAVPHVTGRDVDADFTAVEQQRERDFRRRVRPWGLVAVGLGVVVPTTLVVSGAVSSLLERVGGPWWVGVLAAATLVLVVGRLLTLPTVVAVRRASLEFGLAAGSWARWCRDLAVAFALSWGLTCAVLVGWVGAARAWPERWWLVLAPVAAVLVVVASFLLPVLVEPLFARVTPMSGSALRTRLLALADADGVAVAEVLVADASRRTTALNAYVSGLGATRRIVVHDTLLDQGRDDEVRAVVAHELGHVVAHDVRTGTLMGGLGAATAVAAAAVLLGWSPLLDVVGVSGPGDPAVAAVLLTLGAWVALGTAPLQNAVSRRIERRADQHCLELTHDPATVAAMHRSLALTNLASLRPPWLLHVWFGTHPTSPERIAAARAWAIAHGEPAPGPLARPGASSR